jgi:AcrR family transcriptional regulator
VSDASRSAPRSALENQAPPEPSSLTEKQSARRRRVLAAAMALAEEGGYEAVQMRDVAARADVALGTVYRYFSSKDQLLAAVWADWSLGLERRLTTSEPLEGATRAELVTDFLRRAIRPLERKPKLAAALVTSWASSDPNAIESQREVGSWLSRNLAEALGGLSPEEQQGVREVLANVWYSVLLGWVNGRHEAGRMHEVLSMACHLMLDPREGRRR